MRSRHSRVRIDLDTTTQYQLNHGAHMMELLKQPRYSALDVVDEICAIYAFKENFIDDVDLENVYTLFRGLAPVHEWYHPQLRNSLPQRKISDEQAGT